MDFERVDLRLILVIDHFDLEALNLFLNVFEVLLLRLADVVLQDFIQGQLALWLRFSWIRIFKHALEKVLEVTLQFLLLAAQSGVPVVLDGVVGAAQKDICNLGPPVIHGFMKDVEDPVFLNCPGCLS